MTSVQFTNGSQYNVNLSPFKTHHKKHYNLNFSLLEEKQGLGQGSLTEGEVSVRLTSLY